MAEITAFSVTKDLGQGWRRKTCLTPHPQSFITDRSKAVVLLSFYFTYFCVGFDDVSPYDCADYLQFGLG